MSPGRLRPWLPCSIQQLGTDHPLNTKAVLDVIHEEGKRASTFKQAGHLNHDPALILAKLTADFEVKRTAKVAEVESNPIRVKRRGWFWNRDDAFVFRKVAYSTVNDAEFAKFHILENLRVTKFGDLLELI